jgi:hypothetical protein
MSTDVDLDPRTADDSVAVDEWAEGSETAAGDSLVELIDDPADSPPPRPPFLPPSDSQWWDGLERWASVLVVGVLMLYTFAQLHPSQVFANTTPAGGDLGAHVWGPAYLRDHILPHWRLSGWAPDWYGGFPMYQFYMVIPALMVVLLDVVLPYGISLKIVSCIGIVTLPLVSWAFGRMAGMKRPMAAMLAVAATWFLFDDTFKIYGGNIASTMAGEFSFSIALSLAILYFGLLARALRTGKGVWVAAVIGALAALSHGLVVFFIIIGTIVMMFCWLSVRRFVITGKISVTMGLLASFWLVPFVFRQRFLTDMFYERRPTGNTPDDKRKDSYWEMLFPQSRFWDRIIMVLAAIAVVQAIRHRRRAVIFIAVVALLYGVWAPFHGQALLWNARLLPFMYLMRYMLAFLGVLEVVRFVGRGFWADRPAFELENGTRALLIGATAVVAVVTALFQSFHLWNLPGGAERYDGTKQKYFYDWPNWSLPRFEGTGATKGYVSGWADWNYTGYEKKQSYGEYYGVISTMKRIGQENGCGRALWENNNDQDKYGTPMAQMLLPFWTDGCIGSMEGLFFEAAGSTPYHFIMASALSAKSSNPVRRLHYEDAVVGKGVQYLKTMGVKYYLAYQKSVVDQADQQPDLKEIATTGPWHIYEVLSGNELVVPMAAQPVVVPKAKSADEWLEVGTSWYQHQDDWDAVPVDSGPKDWQRVAMRVTSEKKTDDQNLAVVFPEDAIKKVPLDPVTVTNIRTGDDFVSFDVDKPGVPVMVRTSYFPNWKVDGAKGPYRSAPNFMVVVPTSTHVRLHYGYTSIDLGAYGLTAVGLGATVLLWRRRDEDLQPMADDDEWLGDSLPTTTYDPSFDATADPLTNNLSAAPIDSVQDYESAMAAGPAPAVVPESVLLWPEPGLPPPAMPGGSAEIGDGQ